MSENFFVLTIFGTTDKTVAKTTAACILENFPQRSYDKLLKTLTEGRSIIIRRLTEAEAKTLSLKLKNIGAKTVVYSQKKVL